MKTVLMMMQITKGIFNPPRHLHRFTVVSAASALSDQKRRRRITTSTSSFKKTYSLSRPRRGRDLRAVEAVVKSRETHKPPTEERMEVSDIGLIGLAVMGQNFALNIAQKGFKISVFNRTYTKTEATVSRAAKEKLNENLTGFEDITEFVSSLKKPRKVIILVQAGKPVDATIENLLANGIEKEDLIIDGGNEWYENTEARMQRLEAQGIYYMGMGISGGEEGARNGPSLMPGGEEKAYNYVKPILEKVAAQVDDGPCVAHIGRQGSGNYVKMIHNGIEYGEMQLISEAYDSLKTIGGMNNEEIAAVFDKWSQTELKGFLLEISSIILRKKDDGDTGAGYLLDKILDVVGSKGTGKWTVQQAAELGVSVPTISVALDMRFLSSMKDVRVKASKLYNEAGISQPTPLPDIDRQELINDVRNALYCAKICCYTQGMNIISEKSKSRDWNLDISTLARIWKGGCIIRGAILDEIKHAALTSPEHGHLMLTDRFAEVLVQKSSSMRKIIKWSIDAGMAVPGISASLAYFDSFRRESSPACLIQAQRDFFGSHTYRRVDKTGDFHTVWDPNFASADSATTSGYNA